MPDWVIERLSDAHDRTEFHCGAAPLDDFLKTLAGQFERRGIGRTYVAVVSSHPRILGYYTLALGSIPFQEMPRKQAKKLPKHPVPVVLLGRLAVDKSIQGQKLGEHLLMDAIHKWLEISEQAGTYAIEVTAIDESAKRFYFRYGFTALLDQDTHLFLPLDTARKGMR